MLDDFFSQGIQAYEAGDYVMAESSFLQALAANPDCSQTLLNLGNAYFKQEKWDKAEETWQKTLAINPMEIKVYLNLGTLYYSQERYGQTAYYWEIFRALEPMHPMINLNLGLTYEALAEMDKAFKCYMRFMNSVQAGRQGVVLRKRVSEAQHIAQHNLTQAERHMRAGQLLKAKQAFEQCVFLAPHHPKVYQHYATVLYQLNLIEEAVMWAEKAVAQLPKDPGLLTNLGLLYEKLEQPFQAFWAYQTMLQLEPSKSTAIVKQHYDRLLEAHGSGLVDKTLVQLKQNLEKHQYREAELLAARLLAVARHLSHAAIGEIEALQGVMAENANPRLRAGMMAYTTAEDYRMTGQYEKAIAFYDRYLHYQPVGAKAAEVKQYQSQLQKALSAMGDGDLLEQPLAALPA